MKIWIIAVAGLMLAGAATAAEQQNLLLYINPHEFARETSIGMNPYFRKWVTTGPIVMAAAKKALAPLFKTVDTCEGNKGADVIATISPQLNYNPVPGRYHAKVKVRFHSGDGQLLGALQTTGHYDAPVNSVFSDKDIQQAFENAMRDVATRYAADTGLQDNLRRVMQTDFTRMPCEMVGMMPGKQ